MAFKKSIALKKLIVSFVFVLTKEVMLSHDFAFTELESFPYMHPSQSSHGYKGATVWLIAKYHRAEANSADSCSEIRH